jgi:hypothetical protein
LSQYDGDEEQVSDTYRFNMGTSERCQSCNILGESLQPISRNGELIGEIKQCEVVQWKTRDFAEKRVMGGDVGDPKRELTTKITT